MKNKKNNKPLPTVTAPGHPGITDHPRIRSTDDAPFLGLHAMHQILAESRSAIDVAMTPRQITIVRNALEDHLEIIKQRSLATLTDRGLDGRIVETRKLITQMGILLGEGRIKSVSFKCAETGRFCSDGTCGAKHCPACALKKLKKHKARSRKVRRDWLDDKAAMKGSKHKKAKKS